MDVLTASVPVAAYRATAMTAEEIDAHPDAARIWATIKMMRGEMEAAISEADDRAVAKYDEGVEAGEDSAWEKLSDEAKEFKRRTRFAHDDYPEWLDDAIDGLVEDCL